MKHSNLLSVIFLTGLRSFLQYCNTNDHTKLMLESILSVLQGCFNQYKLADVTNKMW